VVGVHLCVCYRPGTHNAVAWAIPELNGAEHQTGCTNLRSANHGVGGEFVGLGPLQVSQRAQRRLSLFRWALYRVQQVTSRAPDWRLRVGPYRAQNGAAQ